MNINEVIGNGILSCLLFAQNYTITEKSKLKDIVNSLKACRLPWKTNRSDKMRTMLIFFHLTPIFVLSNSFSILPNFGSNPSSDESLSSAYGTLLFTYTIHRYPTNPDTNLSAEVIDEIIENAFSLWSSVSPFQFSRVDSDQHADVQLSFERGVHLRGRDHQMLQNDMITCDHKWSTAIHSHDQYIALHDQL